MVKYLCKFTPNLSETAAPLNEMLRKDTTWHWDRENAFKAVKSLITDSTTLPYFNVKKEVTLTCDASKAGLGAACLQDGRPVAFASRAMSESETRYAQIEKELLAVTFACQKFHDYIWETGNN